jgi:hypothetical protein
MATDNIKIVVEADAETARRVLKGLSDDADKAEGSGGKLKAKFAELRDFMQGPVRAFEMVAGAIRSIAGAYDDVMGKAAEFDLALANAVSTIEEQGGLTAISMRDVVKVAGELSKTTLFEDETIIQASAIAATFKTIGRDIFPEVIKQSANMATIMGSDLPTSVKALGVALEDPINGYASLSRAKIKFTDEEVKRIKVLQESGKLDEAQALILDKIADKMGNAAANAAATATGKYQNLKKTFNEVGESAGKMLGAFTPEAGGVKKLLEEQTLWWEEMSTVETIKKMNAKGSQISKNYAEAWAATLEAFIAEFQPKLNLGNKFKYLPKLDEAEEFLRQLREIIDSSNGITDPSEQYRIRGGIGPRSSTGSWFNIGENMGGGRYTGEMQGTTTAGTIAESTAAVATFNEEVKESNSLMNDLKNIATSSFESIFSALGQDLADGEEGWKSFGQAGLNAVAAVVEAFGAQMVIMATAAWAAVIGGDLTKIPGAIASTAGAAAAYTTAGAIRAIPMASGGEGIVRSPTAFIAGDAGPEFVHFGGAGGGSGYGNVTIHVHGSVVSERQLMALGAAGSRRSGRRF